MTLPPDPPRRLQGVAGARFAGRTDKLVRGYLRRKRTEAARDRGGTYRPTKGTHGR